MYQKDLIRGVWKSAGLYDEKDAKLQQFLKMLDDPTQCWSELTDVCRRSYAPYKGKIVKPILESGDTLVHLMVIRASTETHEDELRLLEEYIASSDPVRDHVELKAIALKNVSRLNTALKGKRNLTDEVRRTLTAQTVVKRPASVVLATQPAQPPETVSRVEPAAGAERHVEPESVS